MSQFQFEIQLIAALVAASCAIPGVFLLLRRMALMTDAISHSVLLGIVLAFFIIPDIHNPLLVVGAAASGVLTVFLAESLLKTRLVREDTAIGLVFPALFSIAVILISLKARDVHIDIDAVLLGKIALAPFRRAEFFGIDLPLGVWVMGGILLMNVVLLALFYKELKLATFDSGIAAALGFSPALIHYGLMSAVSVTAVGAFDHVGSILVVALMIAPPATAYLLTDSLSRMLGLSVVIGVASAISGYWITNWLGGTVNIAGTMATMTGVFFLLALLFAPQRGLLAKWVERRRRRTRFAVEMLLVHLSHHEGSEHEDHENCIDHLIGELNWQTKFAVSAVNRASQQGYISRTNGHLYLTDTGRTVAIQVQNR